jgi:hypothetical protein
MHLGCRWFTHCLNHSAHCSDTSPEKRPGEATFHSPRYIHRFPFSDGTHADSLPTIGVRSGIAWHIFPTRVMEDEERFFSSPEVTILKMITGAGAANFQSVGRIFRRRLKRVFRAQDCDFGGGGRVFLNRLTPELPRRSPMLVSGCMITISTPQGRLVHKN